MVYILPENVGGIISYIGIDYIAILEWICESSEEWKEVVGIVCSLPASTINIS